MDEIHEQTCPSKEGHQKHPNMKQVSYDNQKMLYQDLEKFCLECFFLTK